MEQNEHRRKRLSPAEIQRRKRRRMMHNLKAFCLWVLILVVIGGLIFGLFSIGKKIFRKNDSNTTNQESSSPAASTETAESTGTDTAGNSETDATDSSSDNSRDGVVDLIMVGDVLLHDNIEKYSLQADGTYDYSAIFANMKDDIQAADIAVCNQETIIGGEELGVSGYPRFNAPYALADDLVDAGFDVILGATNHAYDKGRDGIINCLNYWKTTYPNITVLGIHDSEEDQDTIKFVECNGIKIAMMNYTIITNHELEEGDSYLLDIMTIGRTQNEIAEAKEQGADIVIIFPHWGTEFEPNYDSDQDYYRRLLPQEGCEVAIGAHPHVIEPYGIETNSSGQSTLIYYSVGNFVSWTDSTGDGVAERSVGGMAHIRIERQDDGSVAVTDYGMTALVTHVRPETNGITVYKYSDYTEELANENAIKEQDPTFSYDYIKELCDERWGEGNWD